MHVQYILNFIHILYEINIDGILYRSLLERNCHNSPLGGESVKIF